MYGRKTQKRKRPKINIEWKDVHRLRYFILTSVISSNKLHVWMFLEKVSSVFYPFTYYVHARTIKKENTAAKKPQNGHSRLLPLVLIGIYEFRRPHGLLLSECILFKAAVGQLVNLVSKTQKMKLTIGKVTISFFDLSMKTYKILLSFIIIIKNVDIRFFDIFLSLSSSS